MWDGVEGGATQGFPSAKTEASVVQRTPDGVIDNEPSTEGAAVVGTSCADGEELRAAPRQDHILSTDLSLNHSALGNTVDSHSGREIRHNITRHVSVLQNDAFQIPHLALALA
jgi:hypothetical protein